MIEIETFVSAEVAGQLCLPALTEVRFTGGSRGSAPPVIGRLVRCAPEESDHDDPSKVRMRVEVSLETLTSLASYLTTADRGAPAELVTITGGAPVVLGRVVGLAELSDAAGGEARTHS